MIDKLKTTYKYFLNEIEYEENVIPSKSEMAIKINELVDIINNLKNTIDDYENRIDYLEFKVRRELGDYDD